MKNWPRIGFLTLLVGLSGLNLLYVWKCPLDLCGDEAHYWEWARHIDICYYSKGPVVAYLIWLATHIGGDSPFAIRTVAVLLSAGASQLHTPSAAGSSRARRRGSSARCCSWRRR